MEMRLYQLRDSYGDEVGLVYTSASSKVVNQLWKEVYEQDEPVDETFTDILIRRLQENYPETDRLFIEEDIEP